MCWVLRVLAAEGYRSLRDLTLRLGRLTLITGPNGSGKTSTYRVLRLLADAAHGSVAAALAREGGLESVRWAGPEDGAAGQLRRGQPVQGTRRRRPIALRLGFAGDDVGYALDLGLPALDAQSMFFRDPEVKRECIWHGPVLRPGTLLTDRSTGQVRTRGEDGRWDQPQVISPSSSLLTEVADPRRAPEVLSLRDELRSWRFYDAPRTDPAALARLRQLATRTQVMAGDGSDLAAALQTIRENGDDRALHAAIDAAFPGTRLEITDLEGHLDLRLRQTGLLRPLAGSEVSDGTLRYLLWTAALLSPRPAPLARAQRAGDQPAPQPPGTPRRPHQPGQRAVPDRRGHALLRAAGSPPPGLWSAGDHRDRARQGRRRDPGPRPGPARWASLDLAGPLTPRGCERRSVPLRGSRRRAGRLASAALHGGDAAGTLWDRRRARQGEHCSTRREVGPCGSGSGASPSAPAGRFAKDQFDINVERDTVGCPNGQGTTILRGNNGDGDAYFGPVSGDCPLRAQCTTSRDGRTMPRVATSRTWPMPGSSRRTRLGSRTTARPGRSSNANSIT